jgi:AraC-like DNA-binding protein
MSTHPQVSVPLHELEELHSEAALAFKLHRFDPANHRAQADYPHRHSFYQILYVNAGAGLHIIDEAAYVIQTPVFYFLSPGQVHFWQLSRALEGYGFLFSADFLLAELAPTQALAKLEFFHDLGHSPYLALGADQSQWAEALCAAMEEEYTHREMDFRALLAAHLSILLGKIQRLYHHGADPRLEVAAWRVRQFRQLIAERVLHERSVKYYADTLGLSADYLNTQVKQLTGRTASYLIHEALALEAKRLLIHTPLSIQEISYRLHFEDPAYFGRFFRRQTQQSPGQFRQSFREKYQIHAPLSLTPSP